MYNKIHQNTRIDPSLLRDERIKKNYSNKLAEKITTIKPTQDIDKYASNIENAIKEAVETTIPTIKQRGNTETSR